MRDDTSRHGTVGKDCDVLAGKDVSVAGTACVVAGKEGIECCYTLRVGSLNAAKEGGVDVG